MAVVAVPVAVDGLVRAPEAGIVGTDDALPTRHERRDHLPVQVRPAGLSVEAHHRVAVALVHVVEAQSVDLGVVGLERVARQVVEVLVGCPEDFHRPRGRNYACQA